MELANINQYIAWWEGSSLKLFQAKDEAIEEVVDSQDAAYTTLVLPGEVFSRRFHPRPFLNRDKLKKILPTFLLDSLFGGQSKVQNIITLGIEKIPSFTSFSVKEEMLQDFVEKTGKRISPVVEVLPLPFGLTYYAPKGQTSIVVAPTTTGVIAALVADTGEVKDFRSTTAEKWQKEAMLTICGWKAHGNIIVYSIGNVFVPHDINQKSVKIAQNIPAESAALNGIAQLYKNEGLSTVIPSKDGTSQQRKHKFFQSLLVPMVASGVITLLALGTSLFEQYQVTAAAEQAEAEVTAVFEEVLPNTPMVDAVAQISRRLSELSYASGEKIMVTTPVTEQMAELQKALSASGISLDMTEISLTSDSFKLRGMLTNLSDVERVKQALAKATGKTVTLHHAQMVPNSGVDFYMEAN